MDFKHLFTSFDGRIGRQSWWVGIIVLLVIQLVLALVVGMVFGAERTVQTAPGSFSASYDFGTTGSIVYFIVLLPLLWAGLAVYAKRWHDRGKSGWWTLISFVPLIGLIWIIVELGMLRGTEGTNQYGPDPLAG